MDHTEKTFRDRAVALHKRWIAFFREGIRSQLATLDAREIRAIEDDIARHQRALYRLTRDPALLGLASETGPAGYYEGPGVAP